MKVYACRNLSTISFTPKKAVLKQVLKLILTRMKLCSESKPAMLWDFNNVYLKIIKNEKVII